MSGNDRIGLLKMIWENQAEHYDATGESISCIGHCDFGEYRIEIDEYYYTKQIEYFVIEGTDFSLHLILDKAFEHLLTLLK
jgi:hypothetical protein